MKKLLLIAFILQSCGQTQEDDPIAELIAVPDRITLLGPGHARAIALYARNKDGTVQAIAETTSKIDPPIADLAEGCRLRALAQGTTFLTFTYEGHATQIEVDIGNHPPPFATAILEQTRGIGDGFGRDRLPDLVLGPPQGFGQNQGSTDTLSLGLGGTITLGFDPYQLYDGPGPDLLIFENAFRVAGSEETFAEPARVELEAAPWQPFDCDLSAWPFTGCAGVEPVFAGPARPTIDPTDPERAGGDRFELAGRQARAVRITDVATGTITGNNSGFDLDAIALVHVLPTTATALELDAGALENMFFIPRADVVLASGEKIYGVDVTLELQGAIERIDPFLLRATRKGPATITARAGALTQALSFDIMEPQP